ncbi:WXG100 family type VII secretion target [Amnibacterium flavum]|uniref:ESAT-6-like protein n=1 Tax=Amnibacterium flavum TaxID=2173173 RepID=A0A2V1HSP3_9MICO|nr:WXG100 family type VII secretion target [Amnibacterium flavum]PVZ93337.1 WXG100 family type VII secretion target [Amnibacterium flavum]
MPRFTVDSEAVLAAQASTASTIARIQADAAALMSQLTGLQSSWGGEASLAFQSVAADWRATQQRVEESITAINQALGAAGRQYLDVEQANARLFAVR